VKGTDFHPVKFLKTLWDMYKMVVVHGERGTNLPVEYETFGPQRRTTIDETVTERAPTRSLQAV